MAFEALNNAGAADANLLVVLNDNDMSISRARRRAQQLSRALLWPDDLQRRARGGKEMLRARAAAVRAREALEEHMKGMVLPGTMFEELGFNYIGPIDGHDLDTLVTTLENVQRARRARSSCTS